MRKYLQITVVLGIFAVLVILRQMKGDSQPVVVGSQNNNPSPSQAVKSPIPAQPSIPTSSSVAQTPTPTIQIQQGIYKNGTYNGTVEDAFYGPLQVQAIIANGKIADVIFLQYPNDNRTSQFVNSQADPMLKQEAIQTQSAKVDIISGASASSQAFQVSLANALAKAQ